VVLLAEGSLDLYTASETPFTPQSAALHSTSDIASADRAYGRLGMMCSLSLLVVMVVPSHFQMHLNWQISQVHVSKNILETKGFVWKRNFFEGWLDGRSAL